MYRLGEPAFCRSCGKKWSAGTDACEHCGEPCAPTADATSPRPTFRPQTTRVRLLTGLLVINALALAAMLVVDVLEWSLMQRIVTGEADVVSEAFASDERQLAARGLLLASYAATVVVFCTWLFEAGRNLRALGVGDLRWTEEARVLWFFVPVAALVVPLFGMRELWRASANPTRGVGWRSEKVPLFVTVWWVTWAVSSVLAWWSLAMRWLAEFAEDVATANELGIAFTGARLLAIPLLLAVVLGVHRHQMAAATAKTEAKAKPGAK